MDDLLSLSDTPDPSNREEFEQWLEDRSLDLATLIEVQIQRIVTQAFEAFIETVDATTVTASGDLYAIDDIPAQWNIVVSEQVIPHTTQTHMAGSVSAYSVASTKADIPASFVAQWLPVVNQQAVDYALQAENRLRGVGQTLWNDIRKKVSKTIETGNRNETLKRELESLGRFSEYRADTIARTETSSAYINGDYAGHQALGQFGPVEKVWVASLDDRTRPSHVAVWQSSTRAPVPFAQPFQVGNTSMMYPHAPGAPAKEVVNCRCYYDALYPGDRRPNGTIVPARTQASQQPAQLPSQPVTEEPRQQGMSYFQQKLVHEEYYESLSSSRVKRITLQEYQRDSSELNRALRNTDTDEYANAIAEVLDEVINDAPGLLSDSVLYRGIGGDAVDAITKMAEGETIRDLAFLSTSFSREIAQDFADQAAGKIVEIRAKKGLKGIIVPSELEDATGFLEREMILPRGLRLRLLENRPDRIVMEIADD